MKRNTAFDGYHPVHSTARGADDPGLHRADGCAAAALPSPWPVSTALPRSYYVSVVGAPAEASLLISPAVRL
jgi:hypothetical protein